MRLNVLRAYCLAKKGTSEDMPFGDTALCFRVGGKIFGITGIDDPVVSINLKCEPEYAIKLRAAHAAVQPGYHMNKKHWNTVHFDGSLPQELVHALIDHSYDLIFKSLKKSERQAIEANENQNKSSLNTIKET